MTVVKIRGTTKDEVAIGLWCELWLRTKGRLGTDGGPGIGELGVFWSPLTRSEESHKLRSGTGRWPSRHYTSFKERL